MADRHPPHVRARQQLIALAEQLSARGIDRLPGERQLSEQLDVSVNTIKKAIRQLVLEDRLATTPRDGHFILAARSGTDIGLIIGEGSPSTFVRQPEALACILSTIHGLGATPRVLQVREADEAADIIDRYRIHACLWYMPHRTRLAAIAKADRNCPVPSATIYIDALPTDIDLPPNTFAYDFIAVGRAKADWLLARGHERIAYCADMGTPAYRGFTAGLEARGLRLDPAWVIPDVADIQERLPRLLGDGRVTAIFAEGGFERQAAVCSVVEGHAWNGSGDLLIDHIGPRLPELLARHPGVRLTAIAHPTDLELARAAAEGLVQAATGRATLMGRRISCDIRPWSPQS